MRQPADNPDELHGADLLKAILLVLLLGAAFVVWKFFKHNWLADHGYLPEEMRDYWMVYAVVLGVLAVWGVATRFRS